MAKATSGASSATNTAAATPADASADTAATAADSNVTADATGTVTDAPASASTPTSVPDAPTPSDEAVQAATDLPSSIDEVSDGQIYVADPDLGTTPELSEEQAKAREQAAEEEAARIANPNKTVYRRNDDPEFFDVGRVVEEDAPAEDQPSS